MNTPPAAAGSAIAPGAAIGVFGGGQLGRMFAQAAQRMGYRVHVYANEPGSPAGQVAQHEHVGSFSDTAGVEEFARGVDAATLEFENVPPESIEAAERHVPVRPGAAVLRATQHRVLEKQFLESVGAPVVRFSPVGSLDELHAAAARVGLPAVLKTCRMGYDGKGQRVLRNADDLAPAWDSLGGGECVLEAMAEFAREVSVLVARGVGGEMVFYGPIENSHARHILDVSLLPAPAAGSQTTACAVEIAGRVAEGLGAVGLLCVEMFEKADGSLLVNEIAPRPHNSGHLTIEGCRTSQFEQQVRAVCGLPLGPVDSLRPAAMANLLGDVWVAAGGFPRWDRALALGASLHLYGKNEPRPGRKMGHLTVLADTPDEARRLALAARSALSGSGDRAGDPT